MAVCGRDCSFSVDASNVASGYRYTIDTSAVETDVSTFASGVYGDSLVCNRQGTITINSYEDPSVSPGDTSVSFIGTCNATSYTASECICINKSGDFDAKGVPFFTIVLRITDDITSW